MPEVETEHALATAVDASETPSVAKPNHLLGQTTLREEFTNKHAKAVNLEVYKGQLKDIERSFGALLRQLPGKTEVPNLLVDISYALINPRIRLGGNT